MTRRSGRFGLHVGLLAVAAALVRVAAIWPRRSAALVISDPWIFHRQGVLLADGHAYVDAAAFDWCGISIPGAQFPPLFSTFLGGVSFLGGRSELTHRFAAASLGVVTVVLVAIVARRVAGRRAGLAAAAIAAVYPYFWGTEVRILSEALLLPLVALVLLAAWSFIERPSTTLAALLSLAIAAATLTRAEMVLLYPLLAVPALVVTARRRSGAPWWRPALAMAAVALVAIGSWAAYNSTRFDRPVVVSAGLGGVLAGANCDAAYEGALIGWWVFDCLPSIEKTDGAVRAAATTGEAFDYCASPEVTVDASVRDEVTRNYALDYVADHASRVPVVVAARVARMWEMLRPADTIELQAVQDRPAADWASVGFWLVVPFAIAGVLLLRVRRVSLLPAYALLALVTVSAALAYGHPRFRLGGDVVLIVLAGVAIGALRSPFSQRRGGAK